MKGKIKIGFKIIFAVAILVCATLCFTFTNSKKANQKETITAHAVANVDDQEFSALLDGNVIFSVEKVSIPTGTVTNPDEWKTFYQRTETGEFALYFNDINDNGKSKQVVEDGQFVMLNNQKTAGGYINPKTGKPDAIIISLGQYVYYDNKISIAPQSAYSGSGTLEEGLSSTKYAQLTFVNIEITFNGEKKDDLVYRNPISSDSDSFFDFTYLIQEKDNTDIEGHYVIALEYMIGGERYSSDFDFYLVCETSYTKTETIGGQSYSAAPKLGWTTNTENSFVESGEIDGVVYYHEGIDGIYHDTANNKDYISYPTLTYDYTKYQLSYSLAANKVVSYYDLTYNVKANSEVEMVCSVSGGIVDSNSIILSNYKSKLKLITVVFTEQGTYNFSFKYLYTGADATNAPSMDKLKIDDKKLVVSGVDLNYSKQNYTQAQFRKFNFVTNTYANSATDCVPELFIPNGYLQTQSEENIEKYKNKALGLMYTTHSGNSDTEETLKIGSKDVRVGEIVCNDNKNTDGSWVETDRTEDTLQNYRISNINDFASNASNKDSDNNFKEVEYIKSNQGSMWLTYTDKIKETKDGGTIDGASSSFYLYNRNEISTTDADGNVIISSDTKVLAYNNQTSFNQVGYYLVFVRIVFANGNEGEEGWQVYAFRYVTDTVDIVVTTKSDVAEKNGVTVASYTKENVTISWKEPETFESKINGYYYKTLNNNASREDLLKNEKNTLTKDTQILGSDVSNNNFAKYLIALERAGKSATYRSFTIDRQPITGVGSYVVKNRGTGSNTYYEYAVNKNNDLVKIVNGITNSYATLDWNDKASGANITATYSYTPFIADTSATPEFINGELITTKYKLGATVDGSELLKAESKINVTYDSVLFGQGIYVFTLIDEAGNATKYMLIIDKTEAYIQVNDGSSTEILPNEAYRLYGNNVTYTAGKYKAISLAGIDANSEIYKMLNNILNKDLANYVDEENGIAYYTKDSKANASAMQNLFYSFNSLNYVIVKNTSVVAYENYTIDNACSAYNFPPTGSIIYDADRLNGATSLYRKLYIVGENTKYSAYHSEASDSNSYVTIEINKDNSLGMVYYSNTDFDLGNLPSVGSSSASVVRLQTGSDQFDEVDNSIKTSGVNGAHASKDKYFAFTWLVGEDKFVVAKVEYQYYTLDYTSFDNNKYFYKTNGDAVTIYESVPKADTKVQDGRAFYLFKTKYDNTTEAGLYKITRYYADEHADYGDDSYMYTYYYIVDRNGILDVTNDIGKNISIGLFDGETCLSGLDFDLISSTPNYLQIDKNQDKILDIDETYYEYFTTNKVPAVLNIPTGKYFSGGHSSAGYYSGQLRVSIFFIDAYNQLNSGSSVPYQIYEKNIVNEGNYYTIDIYQYLTDNDITIRDKLICNSADGKGWIHLKGVYIVLIEDNVETSSVVTNKKLIGFRIKEEENPTIDIKAGGTKEVDKMLTVVADNLSSGEYEVMTNQEYIRIELPKYDNTAINAQVDDEYVLIKQNYQNQGEKTYYSLQYGTIISSEDAQLLTDATTGTKYIYLNTKLRDADGNISKENLSKPLYYTVTIRYKIDKDVNAKEKYRKCYTYYQYQSGIAVAKEFWYSTYTITIDRLAPTINVEQVLKPNDRLLANNYTTADFETDYYEENQLYFTYQYADYFANGQQLKDIYVFRVNTNTDYKTKLNDKREIDKIYVSNSPINPTDVSSLQSLTLTLPISNFSNYTQIDVTGIQKYGNLFGSYGYYEVLELDKAGNIAQYVVYYTDETSEYIHMPIQYTSTTAETKRVELGTSNENIELFNMVADGEISTSGDYFYYITLKDVNNIATDNWQPLQLTTSLAMKKTGDNSLTNQIINAIGTRKGSYELTIIPRAGDALKMGISLYGEDDKIDLNVENLKLVDNGRYYIKLNGANTYYGNNLFYAKEVKVTEIIENSSPTTKRYICKIENGAYNYYYDNNTPSDLSDDVIVSNAIIRCENNASYKLEITDIFDKKSATIFNTTGKAFYTITSEDFGTYYVDEQGHYYAYSDMTITFDQMFTIGYGNITLTLDGEAITNVNAYVQLDVDNRVVKITGAYNDTTKEYHSVNVILQFKEKDGGIDNRTFNITIDRTNKKVNLKDFTTGKEKSLAVYSNVKLNNLQELNEKCKPNEITSGIMNFVWTRETKQAYCYDYRLYELKDSGIVEIDISSVSNKVINTQDDSLGRYWFIIQVLSPDNELLGNKIYAFEVQQVNSQLYYVKNSQGLAVSSNSLFTYSDVDGLRSAFLAFPVNLPTGTNLPLYITNTGLEVAYTENVDHDEYTTGDRMSQGKLTIYDIDAGTYHVWFGIFQIKSTDPLIESIKIGGSAAGGSELVTVVNNDNEVCMFIASRKISNIGFFAKNKLILSVYYNKSLVQTCEYDNDISYEIKGNGGYSFKVSDTAGNVYIYDNGTDEIELLILREVVVTINDQIPVDNGFYNDTVNLKVYAATKYETGTIIVTAKRNGQPYSVANSNPYVFSEYGTYIVDIYGKYKDSKGTKCDLTKNLVFTIINKNESRTSINLTNLKQFKITNVTNPTGEDVTAAFKQMINSKANSMLITHEDVMTYASSLNVGAGKLMFTIDYLVADGIYPERNMQVQFTLNDETPVINCSLGVGESTKKSFNISFNPGIIYEQIGECYIMINDKIAYTITETSPTEVVEIARSYKEHGDGDYYIKLVGTSGNVWQSFKVEIKEPLNSWAIVVIVVVVVIVATVTITIIVLRRKMRIR